MHIGMKYKSVFQKYCKSEKEKYLNSSVKIYCSQRADLVDMFPDSGFFLKRLDVFMHTHDSKVRYIINITLAK